MIKNNFDYLKIKIKTLNSKWNINRLENNKISFLGGSDSKQSACNVGDPGSIPGSGRSLGEGNGSLLQYSCLEDSMDRSLAGCSPKSTEWLSLLFFFACLLLCVYISEQLTNISSQRNFFMVSFKLIWRQRDFSGEKKKKNKNIGLIIWTYRTIRTYIMDWELQKTFKLQVLRR